MNVSDAGKWADDFVSISFGKKARWDQRERMVVALKKHPRLLTSRPDTASRNMAGIARVLGVSEERVFDVAVSRVPSLLYRKPSTLAQRVREFSALFGKSDREIAHVILSRYPTMYGMRVGVLREKIRIVGNRLGLDLEAAVRLYWRCPGLIGKSAESVIRQAGEVERMLGGSGAELVRCVQGEPQLLVSSPGRIERFFEGMSAGLGVERGVVRKLVLKLPRLMSQRADTLVGNFNRLIVGLGVDREDGLRMVCDLPPLLYLDSERVVARHLQACRALGLSEHQAGRIAVTKGSVLGREPKGAVRRLRLCARVAKALGEEMTAGELWAAWPNAATYGMDRLLVRYAVARSGLWQIGWQSLITCSDAKLDSMLHEYATEKPVQGAALLDLVRRRWAKKTAR